MEYWVEEPPTHVILALRYLGQKKKSGAPPIGEEEARDQMGQLGAMLGQQAQPLPAHLKEMVRAAELSKSQHKGL